MNPFLFMVLLYALIAVLEALQVAIIYLFHTPVLINFSWFRIHFITLGMITQIIFGSIPMLIGWRKNIKVKTNWYMWLLLNSGLVALILGFSQNNEAFIVSGGLLIFLATLVLILEIIKVVNLSDFKITSINNLFYITGLLYLFIGIIVGTGILLGWSDVLHNKSILETHIHANNWGFLSLTFTGIIIDFFPSFFNEELFEPQVEKIIYILMTLGAFGLVFGPWTGWVLLLVPGLLMHLTATLLLLYGLVKFAVHNSRLKDIGLLHFISSYTWMIAPVVVSPFVLFKVSGFENAPQALIYGWVLMVGIAIIPYFITRSFFPIIKPSLGGNWITLIFLHIGAMLLWINIFTNDSSLFHGLAYIAWFIALVAFFIELLQLFINHENLEYQTAQVD